MKTTKSTPAVTADRIFLNKSTQINTPVKVPPLGRANLPVNPEKRQQRVNDAEPAHTIITKLGGPRALGRALGLSGAAVTRWQTHKTDADKNGCDGVIPEFRRPAILALAKELKVRIKRADFLKA